MWSTFCPCEFEAVTPPSASAAVDFGLYLCLLSKSTHSSGGLLSYYILSK